MTDLSTGGLPLVQFEGPETGDLGVGAAQFEADTIRRNHWYLRERRTGERERDMLGDMSQAIYGDPRAWIGRAPAPAPDPARPGIGIGAGRQASIDLMFQDAARLKAQMPGEFANLPGSMAELTAQADAAARRELDEELTEAEGRIANRSAPNLLGGVASFGGGMAAFTTDIEGIATLPLGAGTGSLARMVLVASALGAGSAALDLPSQNRQADWLGRERPDPVASILMGGAFGAALPIGGRVVRLGVNSLTPAGRVENRDLLGWNRRRTDVPPAERGAAAALAREEATLDTAPEGVDPLTHGARVDAAEASLEADAPDIVRGSDAVPEAAPPALPPVGPDAPENWAQIRNGIFAGESGADYNALFAYANRPGGPFEGVRLTEMTVDEAIAFSDPSGEYGQWVKGRIGRVATPMGGYQIVGTTLRMAKAGLGLTGDEVMTPELQERLGQWIYREQGTGAWEGYRGPRDSFTPRSGGRYTGGGLRLSTEDGANGIFQFDPRTLGVDAATYQFKAGGDARGVTDRLRGERVWDNDAGLGILVHERRDGTQWVVNGHQRTGLANRLMDEGHAPISLVGTLYREDEGWSVEMVRALAAVVNIRQDSGSPLDAARVLRDDPSLLAGIGSRSRPFMVQAQGLADLAPGPFQAVVNEVIPQNFGAIVGRVIPDDEGLQSVAIAAVRRIDPPNEVQAESIIRDIRRLGLERQADEAQGDLFGEGFDLGRTVITERARVIDRVMKDARADRTLFARLNAQADTIEGAGNVLDRTANLTRAEIANRALARLLIAADQPGPVRDAIDAAARAVRDGGGIADAARAVFDAVGRADRTGEAGGPAAGPDPGGPAGADVARPDVANLPAVGDAEFQPGLFDDPVDDKTETLRLDGLDRDFAGRLADPSFDLMLPATGEDGAVSGSLRALTDDLAEEADFFDALKTICLPKGG